MATQTAKANEPTVEHFRDDILSPSAIHLHTGDAEQNEQQMQAQEPAVEQAGGEGGAGDEGQSGWHSLPLEGAIYQPALIAGNLPPEPPHVARLGGAPAAAASAEAGYTATARPIQRQGQGQSQAQEQRSTRSQRPAQQGSGQTSHAAHGAASAGSSAVDPMLAQSLGMPQAMGDFADMDMDMDMGMGMGMGMDMDMAGMAGMSEPNPFMPSTPGAMPAPTLPSAPPHFAQHEPTDEFSWPDDMASSLAPALPAQGHDFVPPTEHPGHTLFSGPELAEDPLFMGLRRRAPDATPMSQEMSSETSGLMNGVTGLRPNLLGLGVPGMGIPSAAPANDSVGLLGKTPALGIGPRASKKGRRKRAG